MNKANESKKGEFISVILIASETKEAGVSTSVHRLYKYLDSHFIDYEIVIIEDLPGLVDQIEVGKLLKDINSIRFIELSYKVDYEVAITVGLENSIGDYAIIFNPDRDPLDVILPMVELCDGQVVDIVVGVEENVEKSIGYTVVRPFVSWALNEVGYHIAKNATTLRCLSRAAINSATKARNHHHQIFVRVAQCGLGTRSLIYKTLSTVSNKKSLLKGIRTTLKLLIFNSTKPLRWMSAIGVFGSFFAFTFASYSFFIRLISDNVVDGWSSIVILVSILFMLLFVILSFFGEYLGRLLNDQSKHDSYWILNERHSSVMINIDRQNVLEESTPE